MNDNDAIDWHGHVRARPDGLLARCGGEGLCSQCKHERASVDDGTLPPTLGPES